MTICPECGFNGEGHFPGCTMAVGGWRRHLSSVVDERLTRYHKALADVLHVIDIDDYGVGTAERNLIGDAWEVLNSSGN